MIELKERFNFENRERKFARLTIHTARKAVVLILLSVFVSVNTAFGVDIFKAADKVILTGKDASEKQYGSAQEALNDAKNGDLVVLGKGMHCGPLSFKSSGVTMKGEAGAFINANSRNWKPDWKAEPEYGIAFSSPISFVPVVMSIDGRAMINIKDVEKTDLKTIHRIGVGRYGRDPLQSMFTYLEKEKRVLVSFARDIDPKNCRIEASPVSLGAVSISGFDNCTVENLIISGASSGVYIENSKGSIVRKCLIFSVDRGVFLYKGAENCKILSCDSTWNPDALNMHCANGNPVSDVWAAHKHHGTCDKWGFYVSCAGKNNEIAYNYVYNVWDGIESNNGISREAVRNYWENKVFKGISEYNDNLKVHHNRIDLTIDDALEPGNDLLNNQWHSNYITRSLCGCRFKTPSIGPFFFYDNIIENCADVLRFYKSAPAQATVYIYHNLILNVASAIQYHGVDDVMWGDPWLKEKLKRGTPGYYVFNNAFICEKGFINKSKVTPDFKADYNVFTSPKDESLIAIGIDKDSLFNAKIEIADRDKGDWRLKPGSAGTNFGKDLGKFEIKFPGCEGKYFNGKLPDAGVLGIEMDKIPRGPVSGLWKIVSENISLGERSSSQFKAFSYRWILGDGACEFEVSGFGGAENIFLTILRSPEKMSASTFSIKALNEKGKVLAESKEKNSGKTEYVKLRIPVKGEKSVRLICTDSSPARWRFEENESSKLDISVKASGGIRLLKYDNAPYFLSYEMPDGEKSFKIISSASVEIISPDGRNLNGSGKINVNGVPGTYKILLQFPKKTDLKLEGKNVFLGLDIKAAGLSLKNKWEKPLY